MAKAKAATTSGADNYAKIPPHDIELEKAILGICLIERDAYEVMSEIISSEEVFYYSPHRIIFSTMQSMYMRQRAIDLLTVIEEITSLNKIADAGGAIYITELTNDVVSSAHLEEYCLRVQQKYISRKIIEESNNAIARAYSNQDCFETADTLIRNVELASQKVIGAEVVTLEEGLFGALQEMAERRMRENKLTGVASGYLNLDNCTHGWQPSDLIILAARPSVGKTAFALNLAYNAATDPVNPVAVALFSLEMSERKLVERLISIITGVDAERVAKADFTDEQFDALQKRLVGSSKVPIYIDDTAGINWMQLRSKARRMVRIYGIKMIIIDYLQLMSDVSDGGERHRNREQAIANISRNIKKLAKDLKIPIIALSQLSRAVETRSGEKIPQLSDLRESGAIEQDADVVMFMYRPEYYNVTTDALGENIKGLTEINIAKHRNGKLDTIKLKAHLSVQRFENWGELTVENFVKKAGWQPSGMWIPGDNDKE
jgi:replicative DNA helicase